MTQPVQTSGAGSTADSDVTEHSGMSASSTVQAVPKRLRGQSREEDIFYEEFLRVFDGSDVNQAVKHEISNEYVSDRSAFARRLLANTNVPKAVVRSPWRTFTYVVRAILLVFGLLVLALITLISLILAAAAAEWRIAATVSTVICLLLWGWIIRRFGTGRLSLWPTASRLNNSQDTEALYRDIVRVQISDYLNRVANKLHEESLAAEEETRRRAAEDSAEVVLSTTDAPHLVQLENQDPVRVKALRDLQEFIRSHVTSAIGISGPRGIGKTTIMRQLCARYQDHYVGVYVPAPVKYSPADFVRTIHQRTAEEILEAHGAPLQDPLLTQRNGVLTVRLVAAAGVLLCAAAVLLIKWRNHDLSWPLTAGSALAATAVVLLASLGVSYVTTTRVQRLRDKNPVALARAELERLAWSTKTQTSSTNSLALRGLSLEDSSTIELVERETSHPQRVDAFQKFAALYRKVSNRTIIVAVDELDKISTPDEAIDVINGLKDLMHGVGIHFLVSVSEDALARFALRGIPLRDAFDSTFDTIADVDRFSVDDASDLLMGRVVGMPQVLAYYCHALSGGIPRDLIRFCRECVDVGHREPASTPSAAVISAVARDHATGLLNGAAIRAKQERSDSLQGLLEVREVLHRTPADCLFGELDRAAEFLWDERVLDERLDLVPALPVVLAVISTASSYFGRKWTGALWRAEAESGRAARITNSAASCIAEASVDTRVALRHLASLRKELGLRPLAMSARC
jgi:Cdc6-like AAA superfamily ATPase